MNTCMARGKIAVVLSFCYIAIFTFAIFYSNMFKKKFYLQSKKELGATITLLALHSKWTKIKDWKPRVQKVSSKIPCIYTSEQ